MATITTHTSGTQSIDIDLDGFTVRLRTVQDWDREAQKKTRVYVGGEEKVDFSEARALSEAAGTYRREANVEADKMWDRLNRQVIKNKRAVVEAALAQPSELSELLGGLKLSFSKYAGCSSCPCSPGFVAAAAVKRLVGDSHRNVTDIWIDTK